MIKKNLNKKENIFAYSSTIRTALFQLKIHGIRLKNFTNEVCQDLEDYNNGNYTSIGIKKRRYVLKLILTFLLLLVFNSLANHYDASISTQEIYKYQKSSSYQNFDL